MKVALDATYSLGANLTGVGIYSRELLLGLAAAHPEARFQFCYRLHAWMPGRREPIPANARRSLLAEPLGPRSAAIFHGLNQRLPRIRLRRTVVTFHDLFVLTSDYSTPEFRARFAAQARDAAARADLIIAVSEFTKMQVQELLGKPESGIRVVRHGVRTLPGSRNPGASREKVVLSVGAIQKRKNTARLVEAFEALGREWRLVLAGPFGYGAEETRERIERSPARDRIAVLGYVTAADLAGWYGRASIFAFPSLDEGFGMPVLEAMAAGAPVLTSNRSALPEVAGDAALLVDPEDSEQIRTALLRLSENEELRRDFAARGLVRAHEFTWEKAVRQTWAAYAEVLNRSW